MDKLDEKQAVPHGYCFVLGDNRYQSKDSRSFRAAPLADIEGRLDFIYWPTMLESAGAF